MNAHTEKFDTMRTDNSMEEHAHENWRNYVELSNKGLLRIDQLVAKTEFLKENGQFEIATLLFQSFIKNTVEPESKAIALFNFGSMQHQLANTQEAEICYTQCLTEQPEMAQASINLGLIFENKGNYKDAIYAWSNVETQCEDIDYRVMALNHLGRLHERLLQYDLAEEALTKSLELNPKQPGVIQHWVHIRQKACAWPVYKELPNISQNDMLMYTSPLAMLALKDDPVQQLLTARSFVERTYSLEEKNLSENTKYQHERLRIGYVSGDLCVHAVGLLLLELLEGRNKEKVEIYAYDFSPEDGTEHRRKLLQSFDHVRHIHTQSDHEVALLIIKDEIDVLIDLHGLSSGARPGIFALHPAPKQGTYLGFMGTTGMSWFDFVIADKYALPQDIVTYFTEKPLYVKGSMIPITRQLDQQVTTRKEHGLKDNDFVMAAFGNSYKITPEMYETWLEILKEIPNAILWIVTDNEITTRNLRNHALNYGVDIKQIVFTPRENYPSYRAKLKLADVFLDTYPYNCGSTTSDVIHAGISIITLSGMTMVSRMGGSILNSLGLNGYIAKNYNEYASKVKTLAMKHSGAHRYISKIHKNLNTEIAEKLVPTEQTGKSFRSNIEVHHIAYSEETKINLPNGFLLLDNTDNSRPDWREYWPIRQYLINNELEDGILYGFLSPKFNYKTGLDYSKILKFIGADNENSDVYNFSPFWDLNAMFQNIFEQGDFFHPGLLETTQLFLNEAGIDLNLKQSTTYDQNTIFCNYFIATKKFWMEWLNLGEKLFKYSENLDHPLSKKLNEDTRYGQERLPLKIFIAERLASIILLQNQNYKVSSLDIFSLPASNTPLNKFYDEAFQLNLLKKEFHIEGNIKALDIFKKLRDSIIKVSNLK